MADEKTALSSSDETRFQAWAQRNKIADVDQPGSFYDYRGYWKEYGDKPIRFGTDHFTDTYKQHGHPTFSVESRYSKGSTDGGRWEGERFVPQAMSRTVQGPDGKVHQFPGDATDAEISAALEAIPAQNQTHATKAKTWTDTAIEWLPTIGGVLGGVAGGVAGGPPGAVAGAALGGAAGEGYRQTAKAVQTGEAPDALGARVGKMAGQAALQGGAEVVGGLAAAGMAKAAPGLMQSALKPGIKQAYQATVKGQTPRVVQTLLDEGINVTARGMEKLNTILMATNQEIKDAIASVTANINPYRVTAKLGETAQTFANQVNPVRDLNAISRTGQEFLTQHPTLTVQTGQAVKTGTYKQLAGKYGELKGAEVEAQKALARGLKDEIASEVVKAGGIDIGAQNAKEGAILEAREALARRLVVSNRQNPAGLASLAITHPTVFLATLMDRSPAVKSMLARGMYSSAGVAAKVAPQLIKAAITALATSGEESTPDHPAAPTP